MMTQLFAVRLAEEGIGVYEIRPGLIRTPMTAKVKDYLRPGHRRGHLADPPLGRAGGRRARRWRPWPTGGLPFTVGQAVCTDGGMYIRHY